MVDFTPAPVDGGNALTISGDVNTDPVDWLAERAPAAAEKLRALRLRSADLHGAIPSWDQRSEAAAKKTEAMQRRARLTAHRTEMVATGFGSELSPDHPLVLAQDKVVRRASKELDRISALYEQRAAEWNASSRALVACETYLKSSGRAAGTVLIDHAGEAPPKLKNGEGLQAGIARLKKLVSEIQSQISDIEGRKLPSAYCRQLAKTQIEMLAARGKPNARALISGHLDVVEFATQRHSHNLTGFDIKGKPVTGIAAWEAPDLLALFAHIHKGALLAAIDAILAAECVDAKAMAPETKERTASDLKVKKLAASRDLCALIWAAIEAKLPENFPGDIDPLAALGLELVTAPATAAATGSVSEHAYDLVGIFSGRT